MLESGLRPGDTVCWLDESDVWRYGTILVVEGGAVEVETADGSSTRLGAADVRVDPPLIPFKSNPQPKNAGSRVFLHAVADTVDTMGLSWDDIGFMWFDDVPTVIIAPSVPESLRNPFRIEIDARTPERIVPKLRQAEVVQP